MALPNFSMAQLLEAGVHFGHQKHRWNPKMEKFIFGVRNDIHILDLSQTVPMLYQALQLVSDTVAEGGRVLFVGTKRQAAPIIAEAAASCAQYYVNSRWLGGMLTNWQTISKSIARLRELEEIDSSGLTKKELLQFSREQTRLERDLGGIKNMGNVPSLMFVIDTNKESIAIKEARRLGIPVVAVIDSNCNPKDADFPFPGNDDASRAIELYCDLIAKACIDGISRSSTAQGVDLGASEEVLEEPALQAETAQVEEKPVPEVKKAEAKEEPKEKPKAKEEKAADTATALFSTPDGDADDLKKISGVGPVLEKKLNALGITTFAQVAAFTKEDIAKVDDALSFKGRIDRDDWLKQAEELAKA
ncbi:MAG: 30S ribosomal protein S2 [Devosiaceae bacterium]|nr:30S ribosomal protein S2 [Devosiaceae bacterium]